MKTIFRIEHFSGSGLWTTKDENGWYIIKNAPFFGELSNKHSMFPTPFEEGYSLLESEFCAFKSIPQLEEWVDRDWIKWLSENGYQVLLLDVKECVELEYQIIFDKESVISVKDVTDLFL